MKITQNYNTIKKVCILSFQVTFISNIETVKHGTAL